MLCLKHVRRKRIVRLSLLWIASVSAYFILVNIFSIVWHTSDASDKRHFLKEFAPFLRNESRSVVLLTYQRGGSTLFGNMFNTNRDIYYIFEPLDALYSDMYGTSRGWNVPAEITNYWNGSKRNLPVEEIKEVATFLRRIFRCDIPRLPTSFLVHPYYFLYRSEYHFLDDYVNCIDKIDQLLALCLDQKPDIEGFCGTRFGEQRDDRLVKCYRMLWVGERDLKSVPGRVRHAVANYSTCVRRLRKQVDVTCSPMMRNFCSDRSVRAVKCVRATMDSMEPLLRQLPNLRIIHLIRDPRGVVLSRMKFHDSTRNRYSDSGNDTMVREAELYCRTVVKDVEKRQRLEKQFPGKILSVIYDEFVTDIGGYTERVYEFLGLQMPNSTADWIREANLGRDGKNSTSIATAWKDTLTFNENRHIVRRCHDFFRLVNSDWTI